MTRDPLFRGCGSDVLRCAECQIVLVDRYDPAQMPGVSFHCLNGHITVCPVWPAGEPLVPMVMSLAEGYCLGSTIPMEDGVMMPEWHVNEVRAQTRARPVRPGALNRDIEEIYEELDALSEGEFSMAVDKVRKSISRKRPPLVEVPPAWAYVQAETSLKENGGPVTEQDFLAWSVLLKYEHAASRWRHHPRFREYTRSVCNEFNHLVGSLVIAATLNDDNYNIGLVAPDGRKCSDLYVRLGLHRMPRIEVKAPDVFHWPRSIRGLSDEKIQKVLKRLIDDGADQCQGGEVVIFASTTDRDLKPRLEAQVNELLRRNKISTRVAVVQLVTVPAIVLRPSLASAIMMSVSAAPYQLHCEWDIRTWVNPRFAGEQWFRWKQA